MAMLLDALGVPRPRANGTPLITARILDAAGQACQSDHNVAGRQPLNERCPHWSLSSGKRLLVILLLKLFLLLLFITISNW